MSPDECLAGELQSETRHEYVSGRVYAMAAASEEHGTISGNIYSPIHERLRGHRCRAFMNDMKVLPRPQQREDVLRFAAIDFAISLARIYEDVAV